MRNINKGDGQERVGRLRRGRKEEKEGSSKTAGKRSGADVKVDPPNLALHFPPEPLPSHPSFFSSLDPSAHCQKHTTFNFGKTAAPKRAFSVLFSIAAFSFELFGILNHPGMTI